MCLDSDKAGCSKPVLLQLWSRSDLNWFYRIRNAIIYTPCSVFAYSVTTDLLRKQSYVLRLVVVNRINEPLEIGPGPVFKTCNVTNQLPKPVPGCNDVKKNKLLLVQIAGFSPSLHHQTLNAFVEDWLGRWTEIVSNNIYIYIIYHIYGYWKKEIKSYHLFLKFHLSPNYTRLLLSSVKSPRLLVCQSTHWFI